MRTNKLISILALSLLGTTMIGPTVLATTEYPSATEGISSVEAEITMEDNPIIPPVDPEEPIPPIDPDEVNPDRGDGLSIRYVSGLDFESTEFSTERQLLTAKTDSGVDSEGGTVEFGNMVAIEDIRGTRDGWTLTVQQTDEFINGATISMNPYVVQNEFGVTTSNGSLEINNVAQNFASASNSGPGMAGITSIGMGDVTLDVPENTGVGRYDTTLNWTLISGPV
ncbi:WxL domain-containing protein [Carnobacterium maltaromaticum]|uniref:WxL domain-containing protein n=1 Tax=Carnobacterium maltaromaticum TaxID=2751 RepID=UPI00295ECD5C|nr:WxL domain-containing protein [Carnobacterium maltaromaticum]